jgi:hypothetical protein
MREKRSWTNVFVRAHSAEDVLFRSRQHDIGVQNIRGKRVESFASDGKIILNSEYRL